MPWRIARPPDRGGADRDPARRHTRVDHDAHARAGTNWPPASASPRDCWPAPPSAGAVPAGPGPRWTVSSTSSRSRPAVWPLPPPAADHHHVGLRHLRHRHRRAAGTAAPVAAGAAFLPRRARAGARHGHVHAQLFDATGAVHAAVAFDRPAPTCSPGRTSVGTMRSTRVVGRLLSTDPVAGHGAGAWVSGRASFEMVQKGVGGRFLVRGGGQCPIVAGGQRRPPGRDDVVRLRPWRRLNVYAPEPRQADTTALRPCRHALGGWP